MIVVSERDIDFMLMEEIECVSEFRCWFLARVGTDKGASTDIARLERSISTFRGETDILFLHRDADGLRRAIMIENKIAAAFTRAQAQRYRSRGEDGIRTNEWDKFLTVLIAPQERLAMVEPQAFDYQVSYEEISAAIHAPGLRSNFRRRMLSAASKMVRIPRPKVPDEDLTAWFEQARKLAVSEFPDLPLPLEDQPRAPVNTWIVFSPPGYRRSRVIVEIKPMMGAVDLRLTGVDLAALRHALGPLLPEEAVTDVALSGKSCAIRISHKPTADVRSDFQGQEEILRPLFKSASVLLRFSQDQRAILDQLLGENYER